MKIILNNSKLIFKVVKEQTILNLNDFIVRNSYWYAANLTVSSANTYDRSSYRIKVSPSSVCSVVLNDTNKGSISQISLIEIDSSNNIVSDRNFNTIDMFTENGANITLTDSTEEVVFNIKKSDSYSADYSNSLFKYISSE